MTLEQTSSAPGRESERTRPALYERLASLETADYRVHPLHAANRDFRETNCYADLWLELLHGAGLEPHASLAYTLVTESEGDHWTFYKPPHRDLEFLYGLGVEEMTLWRPLIEHVATQQQLGRVPMVEVDSYFLPDTKGSDYRAAHTKTTIAITHLDRPGRAMRYFHNAGFYELKGTDFDGVFRTGELPLPALETEDLVKAAAVPLPPFCEIVKLDRAYPLDIDALRARSLELARYHFARMPDDPIATFALEAPRHIEWIVDGGLPVYHAYTFSTLRQLGSSHELASSYFRWLDPEDSDFAAAADAYASISAEAKKLVLKLARAAHGRKQVDIAASLAAMRSSWQQARTALTARLG